MGVPVGEKLGTSVGDPLGDPDGDVEGLALGTVEGLELGDAVGVVGSGVGIFVGAVGDVGDALGIMLGTAVGLLVEHPSQNPHSDMQVAQLLTLLPPGWHNRRRLGPACNLRWSTRSDM